MLDLGLSRGEQAGVIERLEKWLAADAGNREYILKALREDVQQETEIIIESTKMITENPTEFRKGLEAAIKTINVALKKNLPPINESFAWLIKWLKENRGPRSPGS